MAADCRSSARCLCSKRSTRRRLTISLQAPPCADERLALVVGRQCQGAIEPANGIVIPTIYGENACKIERAAKIAGLCGAPIPIERRDHVALRAPAFFEATSDKAHGAGMSLVRCALIPAQRGLGIACDAVSVEKKMAEIILRPGVTCLGRAGIPDRGQYRAGRDAPAILATTSEHILRFGVSGFRSTGKPREGGGLALFNTLAGKQHSRETNLRFGDAEPGRRADPGRRVA